MPQPFETFNPKRDPETVLALIRERAWRRARVRAGIAAGAGLAVLILGGAWLRSPAPAPPLATTSQTPVVTRAWSGDRGASVVLFNLSPGRSVIFIQSNQEAVQ